MNFVLKGIMTGAFWSQPNMYDPLQEDKQRMFLEHDAMSILYTYCDLKAKSEPKFKMIESGYVFVILYY
jgi:hypothetical protein